jgi:hypothetical protein
MSLNYTSLPEGTSFVYESFRGRYRILFYSGDTDGTVPTYGSKQWIKKL